MSYEARLRELGIELPPPPKPLGAYVPCVRVDELLFLSGVLPLVDGELKASGKVGGELSIEEGYNAAREAALNVLSIVRENLADLDRVERVVKVVGYVASASGFNSQPAVVNGASELFVEVFGERGRHARVAVGTNELPMNSPVELDVIFKVA
ncbi:MAG: RidA family protein [Candidatus Hydrothermarchaeaceae archaeon]